MNGIIRVFPHRTSYTPEDEYAFVGMPPLALPEHREVHISGTFSWDKSACDELAFQWEGRTDKPVKLGGPAYNSPAICFIPGLYIKPNIIFTTRGCNNRCPHCIVPSIKGRLRELPIHPGNTIQDNNFLQSSRAHKDKVFDMLKAQRGIVFAGGLQADLVDDHFVDAVRGLSIDKMWLACDSDTALPAFKKSAQKLTAAGFNREKIRCYVLVHGDKEKDEARLLEVYHVGAMPMAMLYRDFGDEKTVYPKDTEVWARQWIRPAAIISHVERGTLYGNFND